MKRILTAALALTLLGSTISVAQFNNSDRTGQNRNDQSRGNDGRHDNNRNQRDRNKDRRAEENRSEQRRAEENRIEHDRNEHNRNEQRRAEENRHDRGRNDAAGNQDRRYNQGARQATPRWSRGDRLPDQYRQKQYVVSDWQRHNLRKPPRGHQWIMNDNRNYFLVVIQNGYVAESIYRDDRDDRWRQRYSRIYSYDDDVYYRECRNSPDPAGIIAGGLIGGLLGNAAGSGRTGATIAGVVIGGAIGAALTNNLDCEDRSYAYRTYYDGFNSGRPNSRHQWRNPHNDHRGEFRVGSYYNDPYGFRCADFTQIAYIQRRPQEVHGRACRQPDGAWAIVN